MILSEHQLRVNFANRLSDLRRAAGMTQLELAQKLNYSDKSISKWERAEGVPDLYVAHQIADIFEVSVDYLLSDKPFRKPIFSRNKLIITLLSMAAPWLLATALNWILGIFFPSLPLWPIFPKFLLSVRCLHRRNPAPPIFISFPFPLRGPAARTTGPVASSCKRKERIDE